MKTGIGFEYLTIGNEEVITINDEFILNSLMQLLKNVLKSLILLTFITFIQLPTASADVLSPGTSRVDYCFQVANLNKYSNYLLIANIQSANPGLGTYNVILKPGQCERLNGYRQYSNIYAIRKSQVKSQDIIINGNRESLKDFNSRKSQLIPAKNTINPVERLPDRYGIKQVTEVLKITAIAPKSLDLKYQEIIYTYQQGNSERKPYQSQDNRPSPSLKHKFNLFNLIIPSISIFGIMLVYRRTKIFRNQN